MKQLALITGAAGDIGGATARRLATDGYRVVLADLDRARVQARATEIGDAATAIELDVTDEASVDAAVARVGDSAGSLDVLVSCAGAVVVQRFEGFSRADFLRAYEVNVYGTYLCLQRATPLLLAAREQARVVNVASVAGKRPGPLITPYGCAKAAVISLTRSAAAALGPDVRVNCVCPGVIAGTMWQGIETRLEELGAPPSARFAERVSAQPVARGGTPDEVGAAIAFLASPASSYIVGEDVNVDGGQLMY